MRENRVRCRARCRTVAAVKLTESPAEEAFRRSLRDWLASLPPARAGAHQTLDRDRIRWFSSALHGAGFAGVSWPARYGGRGLSPLFEGIAFDELVRAGRSGDVGVVGLGMAGPAIIAFGTPEQRSEYLPRILTGETLFCQGFSEPEAGSDLSAVRTSATRDGEQLVLNGHKVWSTEAPVADHCLLLARSDPAATAHEGLTCLLVDLRLPGVRVEPLKQLTGEHRFGEIHFTDVRVPHHAVLGEPGAGWRVAMTTLAHERGTFALRLAAELSHRFTQLVDLVRNRATDMPTSVRGRLAELWTEVAGLRWAANKAACDLASGTAPGPELSVLKLRWAHTDQRVADLALDVVTGEDGPDFEHWRHHALRSRASTIEGGTSEIIRDVLAQRVLGLPRAR